ncbi:MAG TPA: type II toxin-antitoxin system VapC family toxin, partial [Urbifossiella sp.]
LSARATILFSDPINTLWLSPVSIWEIIVKIRIGKLSLTGDIKRIVEGQVRSNQVKLLPLEVDHVLEGRSLPFHHHDPFDRLLVCQAIATQMTIVTPDRLIRQYAVPTEW